MTVFHLLGHHCHSQHHRHCTRMNQPDITMVTGLTETQSKTYRWTPLSSGTLWPGGSSVTLEQREPCYHRATEDNGGTVKCGPKFAKLPKTNKLSYPRPKAPRTHRAGRHRRSWNPGPRAHAPDRAPTSRTLCPHGRLPCRLSRVMAVPCGRWSWHTEAPGPRLPPPTSDCLCDQRDVY